jgi:hypothetical protein
MHHLDTSRTLAAPFGPFRPDVDAVEKIAMFRSLACLSAAFFGTGHPLVTELRAAETDPDAAARALALLDRTPTLTRRRMLSVFMRVTWPRRRASR